MNFSKEFIKKDPPFDELDPDDEDWTLVFFGRGIEIPLVSENEGGVK
jgi:hypothetical protein